jgi:peptide/nickel transport system ATP-binding protein
LDNRILSIENLSIEYSNIRGKVKAVRNVRLDLYKGESLAVIGESGSGKTTLGTAIIRLLPSSGYIKEGKIIYRGNEKEYNIAQFNESELRQFRWKEIAMVFQSALNSFNPVLKIWDQVLDTAKAHGLNNKSIVREKAMDLLRFVQLDPERVINSYPHELSGGMRQRVLIALSLILEPKILILDEPTTALDILTQRNIIELLRIIKKDMGLSMIFISHDLSLAAELADRVATMYAGAIVELGGVNDIFYHPRHPYTLGLIKAVPTVSSSFRELYSIPGSPPDLINLTPGCKFYPRCEYRTKGCEEAEPTLVEITPGHFVACLREGDIADGR